MGREEAAGQEPGEAAAVESGAGESAPVGQRRSGPGRGRGRVRRVGGRGGGSVAGRGASETGKLRRSDAAAQQ